MTKNKYRKKFVNLIGRVFGRWTVIKLVENDKHGRPQWLCKCSCELCTIKRVYEHNLINKTSTSCGCYMKEHNHKIHYKGTKDINGEYFNRIINAAKKRNLEFALTILYIQELLEQQGYRCALSGVEIKGSVSNNKRVNTYIEMTASLDRIDSSKGYIIGNVQWVHKTVNIMKQALSDRDFIEWCNKISNYRG